jgi:hypothetical protein
LEYEHKIDNVWQVLIFYSKEYFSSTTTSTSTSTSTSTPMSIFQHVQQLLEESEVELGKWLARKRAIE